MQEFLLKEIITIERCLSNNVSHTFKSNRNASLKFTKKQICALKTVLNKYLH